MVFISKITSGIIKSICWDREQHLTPRIEVEGDRWGCSFGGYYLGDNGCYNWMMQIMGVLDVWEMEERQLVGKNIRVRFSGDGCCGDTIEAIGNIIKDKWFYYKEFLI